MTSALSPAVAHARAQVGALSRSRTPDDPDLIEARRGLKAARLADYIAKTVADAPALTPDQREQLATLLRPSER